LAALQAKGDVQGFEQVTLNVQGERPFDQQVTLCPDVLYAANIFCSKKGGLQECAVAIIVGWWRK
jgi:hypothetical protein